MSKEMNLCGTPCPLNYVKVKLALEKMKAEELLEIILDKGEPLKNVSQSLKMDGHEIVETEEKQNARIVVKKVTE